MTEPRRRRRSLVGAIEPDDVPDSNPFAEEDEPDLVFGVAPGLTLDDSGHLRTVPDARIVVPGGYQLVDGMLLDVPPELEPEPDPEPLWRQAPIELRETDKPLDGEPALECWYGSPAQPWTKTQCVIVREHGAWSSPATWRQLVGAVAFDLARYAPWKAHHKRGVELAPPQSIGRWGPLESVPGEVAGAPPAVWLSLPGRDRPVRVRLAAAAQEIDGLPVYTLTADQRARLRALL